MTEEIISQRHCFPDLGSGRELKPKQAV